MQFETPTPKRTKKKRKQTGQKTPSSLKGMALNNPYQNVPVKSNNAPSVNGFSFPGSVY